MDEVEEETRWIGAKPVGAAELAVGPGPNPMCTGEKEVGGGNMLTEVEEDGEMEPKPNEVLVGAPNLDWCDAPNDEKEDVGEDDVVKGREGPKPPKPTGTACVACGGAPKPGF